MKLLVDADGIVFKAGFATEKTKYLCEVLSGGKLETFDDAKAAKDFAANEPSCIWSRKELEPEDKASMIVDVMLNEIKARYASENPELVVVLGGGGNFRHGIATRANYKAGRTDRPKHYKAIRDHLLTRWGGVLSAGEEADDLIAILATENPGSVIVSEDKDLLQVPGRHFNYVTKEEVTITPKQAVLNFYCQVLCGDSTDSVPGVDGVGPVKARKILEGARDPSDCWTRTLEVYRSVYPDKWYAYAAECARLVYVRRKRGELWEPPAK